MINTTPYITIFILCCIFIFSILFNTNDLNLTDIYNNPDCMNACYNFYNKTNGLHSEYEFCVTKCMHLEHIKAKNYTFQ